MGNSMFVDRPYTGSGGGGGGTPITVIDNLTSTNSTAALSAKQGNVLKLTIDGLDGRVTTLETKITSTSTDILNLTNAFNNHKNNIASTKDLGHVMIDGITVTVDANGVLKVGSVPSGAIADHSVTENKVSLSLQDKINLRVVTFEERSNITLGDKNGQRMIPFDCVIDSFDITLLQESADKIDFNILVSNDLKVWNNLFATDITIQANSNIDFYIPTNQVQIYRGDIVRLTINDTIGDASSMSINMNVRTI